MNRNYTYAVILCVVMCLHTLLLSFYYPIAKYQCRIHFEELSYANESLTYFTLSADEFKVFSVDDNELRIDGIWYDIISISKEAESFIVTSKRDAHETFLVEWFHKLVNTNSKLSASHILFSWILPMLIEPNHSLQLYTTILDYGSKNYFAIVHYDTLIQPPDC